MSDLYILFESAAGYALFQKMELEQIGTEEDTVQAAMADKGSFSKVCQFKAFLPFTSAEDAKEQCDAIANGEATEMLLNFLEMNLPKFKSISKAKFQLGVQEAELGRVLGEKFPVTLSDAVRELVRGIRTFMEALVKDLTISDADAARLGLAHSYSRGKMQLDPNRQDKPIINSIALLDGLDKNINTFAMRVKEWYAWHFPELTKITTDNTIYCKVAMCIQIRDTFDEEEKKAELVEACGSEEVCEEILKAMKMSMGQDVTELDWKNMERWATQVIKLSSMRDSLTAYLSKKLAVVAPNLTTLIGDRVAARLISHAGSLTNLAKFPSSTVQILGAEKALFRALKTKSNTPKYGLIFHSTFIGRAAQKNKGRISRYVANKASLCSRIDCFTENQTQIFGDKMKDQVEERLRFLTEGTAPRRNIDVMKEAMAEVLATQGSADSEKKEKKEKKSKKEKKKRKAEEMEAEAAPAAAAEEEAVEKKVKKAKKDKKKKKAKTEAA